MGFRGELRTRKESSVLKQRPKASCVDCARTQSMAQFSFLLGEEIRVQNLTCCLGYKLATPCRTQTALRAAEASRAQQPLLKSRPKDRCITGRPYRLPTQRMQPQGTASFSGCPRPSPAVSAPRARDWDRSAKTGARSGGAQAWQRRPTAIPACLAR